MIGIETKMCELVHYIYHRLDPNQRNDYRMHMYYFYTTISPHGTMSGHNQHMIHQYVVNPNTNACTRWYQRYRYLLGILPKVEVLPQLGSEVRAGRRWPAAELA